MNENPEIYKQLIDRLKFGSFLTFRNDLELLAEQYGSFRPLEDLAELSAGNKELSGVMVEFVREYGVTNQLGLLALHSIRLVGPKALPYIREEWAKNPDKSGVHYLHMCLIDIIGAVSANDAESQYLMQIIAQREVPLWIEMLQSGGKAASRGLIVWALGALAKFAPPKEAEQAGEVIISFLYDEDRSVQEHSVRGLLSLSDRALLQDALFRLARIAQDEIPLELLLSQSRVNINVNERDYLGKTALKYAEETGNKTIAEALKNAGAIDL